MGWPAESDGPIRDEHYETVLKGTPALYKISWNKTPKIDNTQRSCRCWCFCISLSAEAGCFFRRSCRR